MGRSKKDKAPQSEPEQAQAPTPGRPFTPPALARRMVEMVTIISDSEVVIPFAPDMALAVAVHETYPNKPFEFFTDNEELYDIAGKYSWICRRSNFMSDLDISLRSTGLMLNAYDVILAHLTLGDDPDIRDSALNMCDQLQALWDCLAPAGTMVAIAFPFWTATDADEIVGFRLWLEEMDALIEALPDSTFEASGTCSRSVLIRVDKPAAGTQGQLDPEPEQEQYQDQQPFDRAPVVPMNGNGQKVRSVSDIMPKTDTRRLRYDFTAIETHDMAMQIAHDLKAVEKVEHEKSVKVAEFNAKIKELNVNIDKNASLVESGFEDRDVVCDILYHHPVQGRKTLVRRDGRGSFEEKMERWEWNLFNQPKEKTVEEEL